MKYVLLGYMASGKTIIGKRLAKLQNLSFIDLDDYIIEKEQQSIPEIFQTKGEIYFRKAEHEALKELLERDDSFVLSLGGGTPCYANNMEMVQNNTKVNSIYLRASVTELSKRLLQEKDNRPIVSQLSNDKIPEFVAKHLFERRFFYEKATYILSIDGKSKDEIAAEIISVLSPNTP